MSEPVRFEGLPSMHPAGMNVVAPLDARGLPVELGRVYIDRDGDKCCLISHLTDRTERYTAAWRRPSEDAHWALHTVYACTIAGWRPADERVHRTEVPDEAAGADVIIVIGRDGTEHRFIRDTGGAS